MSAQPGAGHPSWTTQQLVAFLADVTGLPDPLAAAQRGAEAAALAAEAEIGAVVNADGVLASVGFGRAPIPERTLVAACHGWADRVEVPGVGPCEVISAGLGRIEDTYLLAARAGGEFDPGERAMLRAMASVLGLTMDLLRALEAERAARAGQEAKTEQVVELLGHVRMQRQLTLERISAIQRAIASRLPLQDVLDTVTAAAAELVESEVAVLRLDTGESQFASVVGLPTELAATAREGMPLGSVCSRAATSGQAVVDNSYAGRGEEDCLTRAGIHAALAVAVVAGQTRAGSLLLARREHGRPFGPLEEALATTLAEHAGLALQDANTAEALREALSKAEHQAAHDSLTGLKNRAAFLDELTRALLRRAPGAAVLYLDLDHFKGVNDTLGHAAGDRLLEATGERILASVRPGDVVARMGGDEFAVLLQQVSSEADAERVARRAHAAITQPLDHQGERLRPGASVGVALALSGDTPTDLLTRADVALYAAKRRGRDRICSYRPEMESNSTG